MLLLLIVDCVKLSFLAKRSITRVNSKFRPAKPLYAIRKSNMFDSHYILKTIKYATDIQVISTFQGHLVRFVYSEVSLPLARESFSEN